jgi:CubicO group peptidase (beta-lactamase class C family)
MPPCRLLCRRTPQDSRARHPLARRPATSGRTAVGIILALGLAGGSISAGESPPLGARIDALFARWNLPDSPGVIVGLARHGEILHAQGYGQAHLEHGIPLTADTVSESGSVAKQFTAAAVVLLHVRGRLGLEDPIRRHLPELPAELAGAITVRMLLNHTSGLRDIHGLFDLLGRPSYSSFHDNAEVLRVMSRQRRLNFPAGTEYLYCNASYILATLVVERASGERFPEFCRRELFAPRGMHHTRWRDDFPAVVRGRAAAYAPVRGGGFRADLPSSNLVGNGGLLTTVGDLLRWNASFDGATGEWAEVVRLLQTRSRLADGRELDYALGLIIGSQGGEAQVSHGGATSGYRTYLTRFPAHGVSIAVLANVADFEATAAARRVAAVVLPLPRPPASAPANPDAPAPRTIAGLYHCARTDDLLTLSAREGQLLVGNSPYLGRSATTFTSASGAATLTIHATATGAPRRFTLQTINDTSTYTAVTPARPGAEALSAYAGEYHSEELGVNRRVAVNAGRLTVQHWPAAPVSGDPTFADGFRVPGGWHLTFRRDAAGRVISFTASNGRCRHVEFRRR